MHEASLMKGLVSKIEEIVREQQADRAERVAVTLGALSHMSPEHFREHWDESSRGTCAEHAELDIAVMDDLDDPYAQDILLRSVDVSFNDE